MRPPARLLSLPTASLLAATLIALSACGADPDRPTPEATAGAPGPATTPAGPPAGETAGEPEPATPPESLAFTAATVAGEPFDAAELAGMPVVFWFWAPWCPRCVAQAPDVLALAEDVTVVGVGGLAPARDMQGFIDRTGTGGLTHLSDPDGAVWGRFGVATQETLVLIDADGRVVHNGIIGARELRDRLEDLS